MDKRIINNKALLAAYLNMAEQNINMVMRHIAKLMGTDKEKTDSDSIYNYDFLSELKVAETYEDGIEKEILPNSERVVRILGLLHKHFPCLKAFVENEFRFQKKMQQADKSDEGVPNVKPADYKTMLCHACEVLHSYRNFCTHYNPETKDAVSGKVEKRVAGYLQYCFDGGRRKIKSRFGYSDKDFEFLTGRSVRYTVSKDEKGKDIYKEKTSFKYRLRAKDDEDRLSYVGLLLLISLFLHKKYVSMMLDQSGLLEDVSNCPDKKLQEKKLREQKIIREAFAVFRIRLPKERIESVRPDYALGMDMLTELQKCPKELFDTFDENDQNEFRTMQDTEGDGKLVETLLMRYHDRFPYFCMRYIDEMHLFDSIRFQVSLGKYRYKFYDKACIDVVKEPGRLVDAADLRVRCLQKEINGFGRLQEIEMARKSAWADHISLEGNDEGEPYINNHHSSYVFHSNRVGLLFNQGEGGRNDLTEIEVSKPKGKKSGSASVEVEKPLLYLPPLTFNAADKGKDARCVVPLAWMSIYEFPALMFLYLLCERFGEDVHLPENIIKESVGQYRKFFSEVQSGERKPCGNEKEFANILKNEYNFPKLYFNIDSSDVPARLREYLRGPQQPDTDKLIEKKYGELKEKYVRLNREHVKEMLHRTTLALDSFKRRSVMVGSADNKFGKKSHVDIRPGTLARILSRDIMFFMPAGSLAHSRLTGLNYAVFQSTLALFDSCRDRLNRMLENAGILAETGSHAAEHPFLREVICSGVGNTIELYEKYLTKKIAYLQYRLSDKADDFSDLYPATRAKWQKRTPDFYKEQAGRYLYDTGAPGSDTTQKTETAKPLSPKGIELPRGLFENAIKSLLNKHIKELNPEAQKSFKLALGKYGKNNNIAYLIQLYFTLELQDSCQAFYSPTEMRYKRCYPFFDMVNNKKQGNKLEHTYYTIEEMNELNFRPSTDEPRKIDEAIKSFKRSREAKELKDVDGKIKKLYREYRDNEKKIRRFKIQDMLTFLLAKSVLNRKLNANTASGFDVEEYKLSKIMPRQDDGNILAVKIPFFLTITTAEGKEYRIKQDEIKLKNYGDFFRFVHDRRVDSLLPLVSKVEIDRADLEKELQNYDLERAGIFALAHDLEKVVMQTWPYLEDPASPDYTFENSKGKTIVKRNNFISLVTELSMKIPVEHSDLTHLGDVRNAFSHNTYTKELKPDKDDVPEIANRIKAIFAELIRKYETACRQWKE